MPIALSLVNVCKAYGAQPILDGISFGLMQGEKVGLIGRNGAGKSTLFKLLAGVEFPDSGEVVVSGGQRIARLSQEPHFAAGATVREALEDALQEHAGQEEVYVRYERISQELLSNRLMLVLG